MLACALALIVSACLDYTDELSGGYYYAAESKDDQVIVRHGHRSGDQHLPCNVESYDDDGRFIVAAQRVSETCFWDGTNPMAGSSGVLFFWIIDADHHVFYGPYRAMEDYESKRQALGVTASLG